LNVAIKSNSKIPAHNFCCDSALKFVCRLLLLLAMQRSLVQIKLCALTTQSIFSHKITKCHKTEEFHISIPIALLLSFLLLLLLLWSHSHTRQNQFSILFLVAVAILFVVYGMSLPGLLHERHAVQENDEKKRTQSF
jgi:Ca2+/Na+ antiporter